MTTYTATLRLHGRRSPRSSVVKIREKHSSPDLEALFKWSNTMIRFHEFPIVDRVELAIAPTPHETTNLGPADLRIEVAHD